MTLSDGQLQVMNSASFNVRAPEYTVGENGDEAMSGELPASHTCAIDFSIGESVSVRTTHVDFDQAAIFYVRA